MAWIESHQSLASHRKTKKLKRLLRIKTPQVIGHLHLLWWWCLDNAEDGNLSDIPDDDLAEAAEWSGDPSFFVRSLVNSGFIDENNGSKLLHDWLDYAGNYVTQRSLTREQRSLGGRHRMEQLSSDERKMLAKQASYARWHLADMPATVPTVPTIEEKRREDRLDNSNKFHTFKKGNAEDFELETWSEQPTADAQAHWNKALAQLGVEITKANFNTWFAKTTGLKYVDDVFIVGVPNTFTAEYLAKNQKSLIERVLSGNLNQKVRVEFVLYEGEVK